MLTDLRLQHFRSYRDSSFELGPGVNIVVGPNASGKTNLLEALLVIARGGSYRAKDAELLQFEQAWARIDVDLDSSARRTVKYQTEPTFSKTYELDGKIYKRLTLQHSLPVVLFEPNHLQLISGGPERRREYLDDLLEQTMAGYGTLRRQYRRTLAQRNALLKQPHLQDGQLFPWDVRLSHLAGQMVRGRSELVEKMNLTLPKLYKALAHSKITVELQYGNAWPVADYETRLLKKLETDLTLDRQRGFTGSGPHREDLSAHFNGHLAQDSASRGETRSLVLALKILELEIIEAARGQRPLLLLDDVFSELDGGRRRALTEHLANYQTFITTTDADIILQHFTDSCQVIPLGS